MARSGCSRYKYLSRERAREDAGGKCEPSRGMEYLAESSRNNSMHACARVCVNTYEVGEFSSREKPSSVLERQKHLGRRRPACLRLSGEFCGKVCRTSPRLLVNSSQKRLLGWKMRVYIIFITIIVS